VGLLGGVCVAGIGLPVAAALAGPAAVGATGALAGPLAVVGLLAGLAATRLAVTHRRGGNRPVGRPPGAERHRPPPTAGP
jgi:hypothetical protein